MDRRAIESRIARPGAQRLAHSRRLLRAAFGSALVAAVTVGGGPSGAGVSHAQEPSTSRGGAAIVPVAGDSAYTLMQMNLCLSGLAGCYGKVAYPDGVREAVARIREAHPDAVTMNEVCRGDVALIARRTGYQPRFSRVIYLGEPLRCGRPGGRGLFGDAVLTKAAVETSESHAFEAQAGIERRRWLCVTTRARVDVCTAHLNTRSAVEVGGNDAQCAELGALL